MRISTNQYQQRSVFTMLEQQAKLSKTQEQLATGRRILTPADDPAGSARVLDLTKSIETIEQYNANADRAEHRMRMEESVLEQVEISLQRVRELTVQANNASQDAETRGYIASEVRQIHEHLVQLANSSDGNGEYLFAGTATRTQPFSKGGDLAVSYQGDQGERQLQTGPARQITTAHSGYEVFMKVPSGDGHALARDAGRFQTSATLSTGSSAGVTGVAVSDADLAAANPGQYSIAFADNGLGGLDYSVTLDGNPVAGATGTYAAGTPIQVNGHSFTIANPQDTDVLSVTAPAQPNAGTGVIGAASMDPEGDYTISFGEDATGQLVYAVSRDGGAFTPDPPAAYESGAAIEVNGLSVSIQGEPQPGDRFTVSPSENRSLFDVVGDLAMALDGGFDTPAGRAHFNNAANQALNELDGASERLHAVRAENGSRLNAIDQDRNANEAAILELQTTRSQTRDLDYAEAVSRLSLQMTGLQAAQQSYMKIQGLSLFNYL